MNFSCKYCGYKSTSVSSLTSYSCRNSPNGKHVLYEGGELSRYQCKYCGYAAADIASLTAYSCRNSPNGKHEPAIEESRKTSEDTERSTGRASRPAKSTSSTGCGGLALFPIIIGVGLAVWNQFKTPHHTEPHSRSEASSAPSSAPLSNDSTPIEVRRAVEVLKQYPSPKPYQPSISQPAKVRTAFVVGVSAGDFVNVRSSPAASSKAAFKLLNGQEVRITGPSAFNGETEWIPIRIEEQQGWISAVFLQIKSE